jgi:NAD(P)-dependent dehydrogenase (short-subunit alcohol dehydrogenase family)
VTYSISKAGIIMLTRQLALNPEHRIRNAIAPRIVKTDQCCILKDHQMEKHIRHGAATDYGTWMLHNPPFPGLYGAGYITSEVICINGG